MVVAVRATAEKSHVVEVSKQLSVKSANGAPALQHLVQPSKLSSTERGQDVGQPVVVTGLDVLVPGRRFPGLSGELARSRDEVLVVAEQHAATRSGHDLVALEREGGSPAEGAGGAAIAVRTQRLGGILEQGDTSLGERGLDHRVVRCSAEEVYHHHGSDSPAFPLKGVDGVEQEFRVDIAVVGSRVDKHGLRAGVGHRVGRGGEGHGGHHHARPRAGAQLEESEVEGGRARGESECVRHAHPVGDLALERLDILAEGSDPPGPQGSKDILFFDFGDVSLGQVDAVRHDLRPRSAGRSRAD